MKLQLGERLKTLRRERGITQERLAEALGVSCQSVSRWELAACYPDIELLPAIANYFDITLDSLVGMAEIRSEARRREIFTTALNHERREDWTAAMAVLHDALRLFPNDDGLLSELALVLAKTGDRQDRAEAIRLSEKVLDRSTNEKLRSTVRANLCFLYRDSGQCEKAAALGCTLPHIWECREVLLPDLVPEDERPAVAARSLNIAAQVLRDVTGGRPISFSLGYRMEEGSDTEPLRSCLQQAEML
ncbi:MAG: helix-turn-helix transcriptional regulator [Clostridia bacterium]|nr:helix-turn-helix transcriptional regulator [Clostridia bacterium]